MRIAAAIFGARRRIAQPLVGLVVAAVQHPRRHRGVEPGRAGGVGVHVGGDLQALLPRRLDLRDHLVHLRPVRLAGGLEVVDLGRDLRLAADADQLVDRFEQAVPLAAHVRDVLAAVLRRDLAQLDQLLGRWRRTPARRSATSRCRARPLPSPGGPARASRRAAAGVGFRSSSPITCSRIVVAPMNDATFVRDAAPLEVLQVLRQRRPGDLVLDVAHLLVRRASSSPRSAAPSSCPRRRSACVTPWRMSPCERPSTSSDSVAHDSMLMNPGATARPVASTTVAARAAGRDRRRRRCGRRGCRRPRAGRARRCRRRRCRRG